MIRLYLMRHGETEWNADSNRYSGRTDIDISETGAEQAQDATEMLQGIDFDAGIASPLQRTQQTLRIVAPDLDPIIAPELIEINYDSWEGKTPAEIEADDPHAWHLWRTDPAAIRAGHGGESLAEVAVRGDLFLNRLHHDFDGQTVLAVGHGTFNRVLIANSLGMDLSHFRQIHQTNGGVNIATIDEDTVEWITINATPKA